MNEIKVVAKVPRNKSIMTQNNLAPHFTHHKNIWLLRNNFEEYSPDYIFIDIRKGQSPNDFFGSGDIMFILNRVRKSSKYKIIYKTKDQFLFKKVIN